MSIETKPVVPQADIEPGANGEAVKQLQDCLVAVGYMTQAQVSSGYGNFGPQTQAAVKKFQADHGLEQAGRVGPKTRAALQQELDKRSSGKVSQANLADPGSGLGNEPNQQFTFQQLWPPVQKYAQKYGMDPKVLAAIVYRESSFKNHRVHRDGTGHGLLGLDDNGMLSDFEKWSGMRVGRGQEAASIPPEKQLEYAAMALAQMARRHGNDSFAAARQWHRGLGGMNDELGQRYESLIRDHIRTLFG